MSKIRDLPETTSLDGNDLIYAVDVSAGPNGGRKITKDNLKTSVEPSAAEIKSLYESNPDTNAFTDAEKTKLAGVETGATADQIASEVPYDNTDSGLSATDVQEAIDEAVTEAQADFRPSIVSGRILHYTGGTARFDDVFFALVAGDILLNPSITNGEVYVDLDGFVKQTASGITAPPLTIVFAKFSTDLNDITSLTDERVKNTQNLVRGLLADVRDVRAGAAAVAGASGRLSDAMHKHNILTAAASTQIPDQANAEGSSTSLARADHIHELVTAAPSSNLNPASTNAQGSSSSFSRADHAHAIDTALVGDITTVQPDDSASAGTANTYARGDHRHAIVAGAPSTQTPDQSNSEGASTSFSRADHIHNIPADAPTTPLSPATTDAEGSGSSFARNDHTHSIATGLVGEISAIQPDDAAAAGIVDKFARADHKHSIAAASASTQTPDQANAEGVSTSFARADHVHELVTAAPSTTLSPTSTNAQGSSSSFSRADHAHAVATALVGDISTIQPDDAAAAGTANTYARGDHKHAIVADVPVTVGTANSEGASTSFARANHVHDHGSQTTPTHHAVVTTTDNGFMSSTDKTKLNAMIFGFLSYSNSGSQSTTQNNTAYTAIVLDTDTGSLANSLLTKTSTTQFRTDFNGYIRISFKIKAQNTSSNDVAWRAAISKNGTAIAHTDTRANGKTNADRYNSTSGSFMLACANGDLFTIGFSNAEAATTDTITIPASGAVASVHAIYQT